MPYGIINTNCSERFDVEARCWWTSVEDDVERNRDDEDCMGDDDRDEVQALSVRVAPHLPIGAEDYADDKTEP